jgi:hypothetical protein
MRVAGDQSPTVNGPLSGLAPQRLIRRSLTDAVARALKATPVGTYDLVDMLVDKFPDVTDDEVEDALADLPDGYETDSGWVDLIALAEGVVFTHVLEELGVFLDDFESMGGDGMSADRLRGSSAFKGRRRFILAKPALRRCVGLVDLPSSCLWGRNSTVDRPRTTIVRGRQPTA